MKIVPQQIVFLLTMATLAGCCKCPPNSDTRIQELAKAINEHPDPYQFATTPAVVSLAEIGADSIPAMLDLMLSDDKATRLRAHMVLSLVTSRMYGSIRGGGWVDPGGEKAWRLFLEELGNLDAAAPLETRQKAVALWRKWYERIDYRR